MTKQVDCYHGVSKAFGRVVTNIEFAAVLCAKILAETQRFGGEPRLLQLYEDDAIFLFSALSVPFAHSGGEIDAKHG